MPHAVRGGIRWALLDRPRVPAVFPDYPKPLSAIAVIDEPTLLSGAAAAASGKTGHGPIKRQTAPGFGIGSPPPMGVGGMASGMNPSYSA